MFPGFYVLNAMGQKAYLEPFLPMEVGVKSATGRAVISEGEQTMEAWLVIFCHLRDMGGNVKAEKEEGSESVGAHSQLQHFATAMKTPMEWEDFNPLGTTPKQLRLSEVGKEDSVSSSSVPQGQGLTALEYALALVKGELGSKDGDALYNTVHGGIRVVHKGLTRVEEGQRQVRAKTLTLRAEVKDWNAKVALLLTNTSAAWNMGNEALRAVEQLANIGGAAKVLVLKAEVAGLTQKMSDMEATLEKASKYIMELGAYMSTLPSGASGTADQLSREFQAFKEANAQTIAAIHQELKGGAIEIAGISFKGHEACISFTCEHMTREPTYQCIPSLIYAMCMPTEEVVYKSDMQGDEIHQVRTTHNPMQSAVILLVNFTIPAIMEGPKDGIRENKHDFNAAKNYKDWKPSSSMGGTTKNLMDGVTWAFDRIKGAINLTLGTPLARSVMLELQGKFLMHFRAIFVTEVTDYYQEILGKTGGSPPHDKEIKATCWALVTKLLKVIFQEVQKVRVFAADLGNIKDDTARVNRLFLYAALEELHVLRDSVAHQYCHHPKYNNQVVEHLFNTSVPRAVYKKGMGSGSTGGSILKFNRIDISSAEHKVGIDRLEMAVGSICSHLQLPATAPCNRGCHGGGGGIGAGVVFAGGTDAIE
jgi:hypothetical protein